MDRWRFQSLANQKISEVEKKGRPSASWPALTLHSIMVAKVPILRNRHIEGRRFGMGYIGFYRIGFARGGASCGNLLLADDFQLVLDGVEHVEDFLHSQHPPQDQHDYDECYHSCTGQEEQDQEVRRDNAFHGRGPF